MNRINTKSTLPSREEMYKRCKTALKKRKMILDCSNIYAYKRHNCNVSLRLQVPSYENKAIRYWHFNDDLDIIQDKATNSILFCSAKNDAVFENAHYFFLPTASKSFLIGNSADQRTFREFRYHKQGYKVFEYHVDKNEFPTAWDEYINNGRRDFEGVKGEYEKLNFGKDPHLYKRIVYTINH